MSLRKFKVAGSAVPAGSWLSKPVFDAGGELLAEGGSAVNEVLLERLCRIEELEVFVDVKDSIEGPEAAGPKNFVLEESIREQAVDSVKYIYSGISGSEAVYESNRIADIICEAIGEADGSFNIENLRQYDEYTYRHSVDVAFMAGFLAKSLELPGQAVKGAALTGILHDIGKVRISLEILNKEGRLTDEEFEVMKGHPLYGFEMLKEEKHIPDAVKYGVLTHHEKYFGDGYVLGLSRKEIPAYGRLIAIADCFDALISDRPYHPGRPAYKAIEIMREDIGHYDTFLLQRFMSFLVLYPAGTCLVLSNGAVCIVEGEEEGCPYHSCLRDVRTGEEIDLLHDLRLKGIKVKAVMWEEVYR